MPIVKPFRDSRQTPIIVRNWHLVLACSLAATQGCGIVNHPHRHDPACIRDKTTSVKKDFLPITDVRQLNHLSPDSMAMLRKALNEGCWPQAIKLFVRNYQPQLPAWVVYVDSGTKVHQGWIINGSTSSMTANQQFVWAIFFSEHPLRSLAGDTTRKAAPMNGDVDQAQLEVVNGAVGAVKADSALIAALNKSTGAESNAKGAETKTDGDVDKDKAKALADAQHMLLADLQALAAATTAYRALGTSAAAALLTIATTDTADLRFSRRTVFHAPDPRLIQIIAGIGKGLGFAAPNVPSVIDSTRMIHLEPLAKDSRDSMRAGYARFGLLENSVTELSLSAVPGKRFPNSRLAILRPSSANAGQFDTTYVDTTQLLHSYSNLANAKQHTFELGVLMGVTHGSRAASYDPQQHLTGRGPSTGFAGDAVGFVNAPWWWVPMFWHEPWRRSSLGVFAGTNVVGTLGNEFAAGFSIGHIVSDAGLSIGAQWTQEQRLANGSTVTSHRPRFLIGTDLRF